MIAYMGKNWFSDAIISLMGFLNECVYGLVGLLAETFMDISNVMLFDDATIQSFLDRIYVVLGIYMLFKLAISLLMAIVNPDNLTDKEKGMQKIIPRTVIALCMLIIVPTIFEEALKIQDDIAMAVPRIIIGKSAGSSTTGLGDQGEQLAATALSAFLTHNNDCTSETAEEAATAVGGVNTVSALIDYASLPCEGSKTVYRFEFNGIVGIFAGIFLVVSLASYCVDIAIRVIKIGLLRLLAPIPIISYIDPKSEKQGAFGNWLKECVSTYVELFIKLGILYFVIFILSSISQNSMFSGTNTTNAFVNVFLIIGAFFFMGKAADFICNILGVKKPDSSGGGFFKGLAGLAGLGLGAMSAGITNVRGSLQSRAARGKTNPVGGFFSGAAGLATGLVSGGVTGLRAATSSNATVGSTLGAIQRRNDAYMRSASAGGTGLGRARSAMSRAVLGYTPAQALQAKLDDQQAESKAIGDIISYADDKAKTSNKTSGTSSYSFTGADGRQQTITVNGNYKAWTAAVAQARATGSKVHFDNQEITLEHAEMLDYGLFTSNSSDFIRNHGFTDADGNPDDLEFKNKVDIYNNNHANNPIPTGDGVDARKAMKKAKSTSDAEVVKLTEQLRVARSNDNPPGGGGGGPRR